MARPAGRANFPRRHARGCNKLRATMRWHCTIRRIKYMRSARGVEAEGPARGPGGEERMEGDRVTRFGGTTGRVLCDAMSIGTAVTGIVLGLAILAESFVLGMVGARALAQLVAQVLFAIVLARFT